MTETFPLSLDVGSVPVKTREVPESSFVPPGERWVKGEYDPDISEGVTRVWCPRLLQSRRALCVFLRDEKDTNPPIRWETIPKTNVSRVSVRSGGSNCARSNLLRPSSKSWVVENLN